jgi:rubrerythrin
MPSPLTRSATARALRLGIWALTVGLRRVRKLKHEQVAELLYQALETEKGGIQIYETALKCAVNDELKEEWEEYLEQTRNHEQIVLEVMEKMGLDPETATPGREVVRHIGESLVEAMEMALEAGKPEAAQLVACECIVLAETKDHLNWELIHEVAEKSKGEQREALKSAYEQVEDQEDEHLYHTTGWGRELWIESLGMPAVLPPPEEEQEVKTAIGAARAKKARKKML